MAKTIRVRLREGVTIEEVENVTGTDFEDGRFCDSIVFFGKVTMATLNGRIITVESHVTDAFRDIVRELGTEILEE